MILINVGLANEVQRLLPFPEFHFDENVLDLTLLGEFLEQSEQRFLVHLGRVSLLLFVLLDQFVQFGGIIYDLDREKKTMASCWLYKFRKIYTSFFSLVQLTGSVSKNDRQFVTRVGKIPPMDCLSRKSWVDIWAIPEGRIFSMPTLLS